MKENVVLDILEYPEKGLRLQENETHVCFVDFSAVVPLKKEKVCAVPLLSEEERHKAMRFIRDEDRTRFIAGRLVMKKVIAGCRGVDPGTLKIFSNFPVKGWTGKKYVPGGPKFNYSKSETAIVISVSLSHENGIDVEHIRENRVKINFFSPYEQEILQSLPKDRLLAGLFKCATQKEAFVKALGLGLSLPFEYFDVSPHPDQPGRLIAVRPEYLEKLEFVGYCEYLEVSYYMDAARWEMHSLDMEQGYAVALAVEKKEGSCRIVPWKWKWIDSHIFS